MAAPLFYDALSGEFAPRSDPLKRKHTLGRLAVAAVQKGEVQEQDDSMCMFQYEPSWAAGVVAVATCSTGIMTYSGSDEIAVPRLTAISLVNSSINTELSVYEDQRYPEGRMELVIVENETPFVGMSLELGPDIASTRKTIAARAQYFFDI